MNYSLRHILVVSSVVLIFLSACGRSDDKVIPRGKLSRIYAEMLLTDQWIKESVDVRRMADTTLIYEPILEKYGYDKMDYIHTVHVYLDDPERFAKVWEHTSEILDARLNDLKAQKKAIEEAREKSKIVTDFCAEIHFPYMYDEPYVHYYDSLSVEMDTLLCSYRFRNIERSDTTYEGLVMNIRIDSLSVADSVVVSDSLQVCDSIMKPDPEIRMRDIAEEVAVESVQPSDELRKIKDVPHRKLMPVTDLKK